MLNRAKRRSCRQRGHIVMAQERLSSLSLTRAQWRRDRCAIVPPLSGIRWRREREKTLQLQQMRQWAGSAVEVIHSTIQQEGFHQEQIRRNEQTSRVCLVQTNGGRSTDHSNPPGRRLMQTCVIIRTPFISLLMIAVPALGLYCLFGWEHKRYALILYSSIVEPVHCTCECGAKWAQLRRAMPPRTDEGLKLGGKEQSKATCCLLYVHKKKLQPSPTAADRGWLHVEKLDTSIHKSGVQLFC